MSFLKQEPKTELKLDEIGEYQPVNEYKTPIEHAKNILENIRKVNIENIPELLEKSLKNLEKTHKHYKSIAIKITELITQPKYKNIQPFIFAIIANYSPQETRTIYHTYKDKILEYLNQAFTLVKQKMKKHPMMIK
ncbi:MAG: hypothetical protein PVI75_05275 [Gammaproteobacteria bacterium]|jgi:hypothetical protein